MEIRIADKQDIDLMMSSRLEMLKEVNSLDANYRYSESFVEESRRYFLEGDQTTVLALDGEIVIGCATICYFSVMPTFSHPSGKRAHLMNVYTAKEYRKQGIGMKMVNILIDDAWNKGATEVGRPLYKKCGFEDSEECMVLVKEK